MVRNYLSDLRRRWNAPLNAIRVKCNNEIEKSIAKENDKTKDNVS